MTVPAVPVARAADQPPAQTFGSGAWIWFSDPRAVYFKGQHRASYVAWVNIHGNAMLGSYDHDTNAISTVILKRGVGRDDHANPTLQMLPDGRLMATGSFRRGVYLFRLPEVP